MKKRGFVIFFLARSGSTYVITQLRTHPEIIARAEVFGSPTLPDGKEQYDDGQIRFVRRFFREFKKDLDLKPSVVRGFKVQPEHIKNPARLAKVLKSYDVCPFFLYRRNKVKQLVSSYRAAMLKRLTEEKLGMGYAHLYPDKLTLRDGDLPKIEINPREFKKQLREKMRQERILDRLKEKTGSCLDLYYEDMMADKEGFFRSLCDKIGLDAAQLSPTDGLLKITSEDLRDSIENFDQLHEALRGTEFEAQLLEGTER